MAKTFKQTRRLTKMVSKKLENWIDITVIKGDAYNAMNLEKQTLKVSIKQKKWQLKINKLKQQLEKEA